MMISAPRCGNFWRPTTRRHINNIAVYGLHHEARQRWLMAAGAVAPDGVRIDLHFVHHRAPPPPWALASAVTHTGRSSAALRVAMFDGQALQATADCVMVYTDPAGPPGAAVLPPALRAALQSFHWLSGDTPCP